MEALQKRLEALEQQTEQLKHHTQAIERRLRWWRRLAYGLGVLGLLSLPLTSGTAQEGYSSSTKELRSLARRVEDLEYKLVHITSGPDDVTISGANLRVVNGLGATNTTNGVGNIIVGYNEDRGDGNDTRTGSHNVVVGRQHNFSSFGGLVVAQFNEISGPWASVTGGTGNTVTASGFNASVSGGELNTASGLNASVSGGFNNTASGMGSSVSGGFGNRASGMESSVSGGINNTASGPSADVPSGSSVSGGANNRASQQVSSVSGGISNTASGNGASVSGGEGNVASGFRASVNGGENNTASGNFSSVSGGSNRSAPGTENWAAGPLFADH
jgi:trimeric autotransporter adhesin